jgi:uncharacterized protein
MSLLLWCSAAFAAALPGVPVPFDVTSTGLWVLPGSLPQPLAAAGAEPGWVLTRVDDAPFDPTRTPSEVARGPARPVRLTFLDPTPDPSAVDPTTLPPATIPAPPAPTEAILVIRRSELVLAEQAEVVPWPAGFAAPARAWAEDASGLPVIQDAKNKAWRFDPTVGTFAAAEPGERAPFGVPDVFWSLSEASWVVVRSDGLTTGDRAWARQQLAGTARVRGFRGKPGDQLLLGTLTGLEVLQLYWPYGTPALPTCSAAVPETCLASGRQLLAELANLPGAQEEARRQFELACSLGVFRACFEVEALDEPRSAAKVQQCQSGSLSSCISVAVDRFELEAAKPGPVALGMLEHTCSLEGSGTLGERLRRLDEVGAGCMRLVTAYDQLGQADQAMLNLDQACVLGRADACEQATERRAQAFAARTVRECEDPQVPNAASCVDLGRLLQQKPVAAASLDEFGAFLRGCTLGAPEGCLLLGDYVDRWGIEHPRVVEAEDQLLASCEAGEQRACLGAGDLLVRHEPRTRAYGQALQLFDRACSTGLAAACVDGARQRRIGRARTVKAPSQEEMWTSACDANSAPGCAGLGEALDDNKAGWPAAYTAWTKACDLGEPAACSDLGQLVAKPHGKAWDGEQSAESYLQRGCDNGDPRGCYLLAKTTLPKRGPPDEPTYLLLENSCEGEFGLGCSELGEVHIERKTSFDDEIAARHFSTACDNGHYESCRELGEMYLVGKGVERDRQKANELLDRFRLNARAKYLRFGLVAGFPVLVGGEAEVVIPIPIGPALSIAGAYSSVPGAGTVLTTLQGDDRPVDAPNLVYRSLTARVYPNHRARGAYAAAAFELVGDGVNTGPERDRVGYSVRIGMRNDTKFGYSGVEFGLGQYGFLDLADFSDDSEGLLPLIVPTLAFSFGFAPF